MEKLPVQYHIEVYEGALSNDPSLALLSSSPLQPLSVGDYYNHQMTGNWCNPPEHGERFRIKEIEHIIWEIEESHIGHKLMVCLEVVQGEN